MRSTTGKTTCAVLVMAVLTSCRLAQPPPGREVPRVFRGQERFGLSFEDRMAIPGKLSQVRAEAHARANAVYARSDSREDAIRNEEYGQRLEEEGTRAFLEEHQLTPEELDLIIEEYQLSLGAPLR